jgi:hypothetical protein
VDPEGLEMPKTGVRSGVAPAYEEAARKVRAMLASISELPDDLTPGGEGQGLVTAASLRHALESILEDLLPPDLKHPCLICGQREAALPGPDESPVHGDRVSLTRCEECLDD